MPKDEHIKTLNDIQTMGEFEKMFKDGIVLAKLINCLYPGKIKKTKEQENIQNFIDFAISEGGCLKGDMFEFVDLYEAVNLISVIDGMAALGRKCHSHPDPSILASVPKKRKRTNENSRRSNSMLESLKLVYKWVPINAPRKLASTWERPERSWIRLQTLSVSECWIYLFIGYVLSKRDIYLRADSFGLRSNQRKMLFAYFV